MYFDNIYFAKDDVVAPSAPTTAPAVPTEDAADVVSLYSDEYTTTGGFDLPYWGQSSMLADTTVASNKVLKGEAFTYQGFQFGEVNATEKGLGKLHLDIWSQDATPVKVYVISAGQDSEYVAVTPTAGAWKSVEVDLDAFTKIDKTKIFQVKLDTGIQPTTKVMYFDNIYFAKDDVVAPSAPTTAPAVPTEDAADVISLYSDSYDDVPVDTWSAGWDQANVSDATVAGNAVKRYADLVFAGIEFTGDPIDTSAMTHLHLDVWKRDPDSQLKIKLVDFGTDGVYGGGNEVEHEVTFNTSGTPDIAGNEWVGLDIPLSEFTGLTTREHVAQMVVSGGGAGDTLWVDNVYFYNANPVG
jgi:hypothetical protein